MQSILSYARAFEENCGVCFVDMRLINTVVAITFSHFLATNSKATYVRSIRFDNIVNKHKDMPPLLMDLGRYRITVKSLYLTPFDDTGLYISSEQNILLKIQFSHVLIKINQQPTTFDE